MSYLHISNLYRPEAQVILLFKEVYCLEKIHGTSAHISFNPSDNSIHYFSGGESHSRFVGLFKEDSLITSFKALTLLSDKNITIYGEAYGGKQQGMSLTYGKELKFIAFDVKIGDNWLSVPEAEAIVKSCGLEFVYYNKVSTTRVGGVVSSENPPHIEYIVETDLTQINAERDRPSTQAKRNGILEDKISEGVVIRPLQEMTMNNGNRVIVEHKRDEFRETATVRSVEADPVKLKVLADAEAIALEWVTEQRLEHILQKIPNADMKDVPVIMAAMVEDVLREGSGEIKDSPEAQKAIKSRAVKLFKDKLQKRIGT